MSNDNAKLKGGSGWQNFQEYEPNKPIPHPDGPLMTVKSVYGDDYYRKVWERLLENNQLEDSKPQVYKWEDQGFLKINKKKPEKKVKTEKKKKMQKQKQKQKKAKPKSSVNMRKKKRSVKK